MIELLKATNVRTAIKYGQGLGDLAEKYECSEADVARRIRMLFQHDGEKILRELQDSAKKVSGVKNRGSYYKAAEETKAVIDDIVGEAEGASENALENTESAEGAVAEAVLAEAPLAKATLAEAAAEAEATGLVALERPTSQNLQVATGTEAKIQALKTRKEALEGSVLQAKCDYNNAFNYHTGQVKLLELAAAKLDKLREQYDEACAEFQALVEEDNTYTASMKRSRTELKEKEQELGTVERKLQEMLVTTICLYTDGKIAVFDGPAIPLITTGADKILGELISLEACEALRLKELKALADAMAILENAKAGNFRCELVVEDAEVAKIYSTLAGGTSPDESVA